MTSREPAEFMESLSAVLRCIRSAGTQAYGSLDLGSTQAKLLRHIGRNSRPAHQPLSQADLARATGTDPALTGRALETLIERGWVRRSRSGKDRRQYLLELTVSGQRMGKRVGEARAQIARRVGALLDERDLDDFDRIAKKIRAAFELDTTGSDQSL